jgi:hypothetical protein
VGFAASEVSCPVHDRAASNIAMKPTTQVSAAARDVRLLFSEKSIGEDLGAFTKNALSRHFQQSPGK